MLCRICLFSLLGFLKGKRKEMEGICGLGQQGNKLCIDDADPIIFPVQIAFCN